MLYAMPGQADARIQFKTRYDNFIGGKWVAPVKGDYFDVLTPISGSRYTQAARSTAEDVELALDAAHAAFPAWSQTTREQRLEVMGRIIEEYKKRTGDLAQSMAEEMGAPVSFAATAQVGVLRAQKTEAEALLKQVEANLDAAKRDLDYTTIRAPINGVVGNKHIQITSCAIFKTQFRQACEFPQGIDALLLQLQHAIGRELLGMVRLDYSLDEAQAFEFDPFVQVPGSPACQDLRAAVHALAVTLAHHRQESSAS